MLIEIANNTTREIFRSKTGFTVLGDNGLILGYVQTDDGKHIVEVERYYTQEAVLSHFKSREDAIKFICTFEQELPRLHTVYDKLHTHTGIGAFRVFNPKTSYPFHVGLDSDTHLHFGFGDVGTGKTTVSYAEKDAEVTRDYFMQTMNSLLHEIIYSEPKVLGYGAKPILPTLTVEEKFKLLETLNELGVSYTFLNTKDSGNKPIIQPSDKPYNFEDIHKIIKNSTYHPPKCPFSSSNSSVHTMFVTDPHLSNILGGGLNGKTKNPYEYMTGEQLEAFVKQISTLGSVSKDFFVNNPTEASEEVPKPQHLQAFEEKLDKKQSERKTEQVGGRSVHRGDNHGRKRNRGTKPNKLKSPYTNHRKKHK